MLRKRPGERIKNDNINRKSNIDNARAGRIEREISQGQCLRERGVGNQQPVQNGLPVKSATEDKIRRVRRRFDPIAFRIDVKQRGCWIAFELPANDRMQIKTQSALGERRSVFLANSAQLVAKGLRDLIEAFEIRRFFGELLFKINDRLVAQRAQPGGHDEKPLRAMLHQRELAFAEPLVSFDDLRIGQRHQTLLYFYAQRKTSLVSI